MKKNLVSLILLLTIAHTAVAGRSNNRGPSAGDIAKVIASQKAAEEALAAQKAAEQAAIQKAIDEAAAQKAAAEKKALEEAAAKKAAEEKAAAEQAAIQAAANMSAAAANNTLSQDELLALQLAMQEAGIEGTDTPAQETAPKLTTSGKVALAGLGGIGALKAANTIASKINRKDLLSQVTGIANSLQSQNLSQLDLSGLAKLTGQSDDVLKTTIGDLKKSDQILEALKEAKIKPKGALGAKMMKGSAYFDEVAEAAAKKGLWNNIKKGGSSALSKLLKALS